MSTTIGLGIGTANAGDLIDKLASVARKYDYDLKKGTQYAEEDVLQGITVTKEILKWQEVALLETNDTTYGVLALGIHNELTAYETQRIRPKFFDFLDEISQLASMYVDKITLFFASEWDRSDHVKFSYGSVEQLKGLLSLPGHWGGVI